MQFDPLYNRRTTKTPISRQGDKSSSRNRKEGLWGKTRAAFAFIFEHYRERFDWFLKADDDTYVIVDNVRYFLATKDTNEPSYFGNMFHIPKSEIKFDYMSGGAGYVINKEALRMFMSVMYTESLCPFDGVAMEYPEDVMVGYCLKKAGVTARSSLDSMGRARFLPLRFIDHINGVTVADWFRLFSREAYSLVSLHYILYIGSLGLIKDKLMERISMERDCL
ncbi:hypothetical protein BSL78_07481 [Apostichopus japonicus]|uniref:N-acetylgalactosaminide beta-1,3-galactosyltransferase n=1 Tax=Stichopus japonicus TaxID=307972 RepID=A0A2G8L5S2_STIJA|nr:hypothetical protein BSL78_07481 [Apostichopus japonicus]